MAAGKNMIFRLHIEELNVHSNTKHSHVFDLEHAKHDIVLSYIVPTNTQETSKTIIKSVIIKNIRLSTTIQGR